jgi:uncharacterized peroxidase-related enzyme
MLRAHIYGGPIDVERAQASEGWQHEMWIETVEYDDAAGRLKTLYDRVRAPDGQIDNIMKAHGLRPHTLEGHMTLYKYVLHHPNNALPKWQLEMLGVYVSLLNGCAYCVEHHFAGMKRLMKDDARAESIRVALESGAPEEVLDGTLLAMARYAEALTRDPGEIDRTYIEAMREAGLDDGMILEVNQVVAYFAYANRTVLGLGVSHAGEVLGLSPGDSDDPDNWTHA